MNGQRFRIWTPVDWLVMSDGRNTRLSGGAESGNDGVLNASGKLSPEHDRG
jgi:hypothetical protein